MFVFYVVQRDKGGGAFPQVCRLCWLSSDVTSATVSTYYVIPLTGSGIISVLLQVASLTSLHMRRHAQRHIQGGLRTTFKACKEAPAH